jgi:3-oxoadipate enol-lactonase
MTEHGTIFTDDGFALAWRSDGDPALPPLLLANSLGTTMAMWDSQIWLWTQSHFVIRFDTCGHGGSAIRPVGFGIDRLGLDALAVLDHLAIDRANFVGLSLGGMVGQWLAIHNAHRIGRLVLANTSAHMPSTASWDARIASVFKYGVTAIGSAVVERWFTPEFRAQSPVPAMSQAMLVGISPLGYMAACVAIRDMDFSDSVSTITCPTLIIGGLHDPATPPPHSIQLAKAITGAAIIWLEAAHLSNAEQPQLFATAVNDFLSADMISFSKSTDP